MRQADDGHRRERQAQGAHDRKNQKGGEEEGGNEPRQRGLDREACLNR
jgi:hypothetical protein